MRISSMGVPSKGDSFHSDSFHGNSFCGDSFQLSNKPGEGAPRMPSALGGETISAPVFPHTCAELTTPQGGTDWMQGNDELQARMARGVQAIVDECEAHGSTNDKAEFPTSRKMGVEDFCATIYHALDLKIDDTVVDHSGRPVHLVPSGEVLRELL